MGIMIFQILLKTFSIYNTIIVYYYDFWRSVVLISLNNTLIKELSLLPEGAKIMIIGEADTGKSTVVAALARWFQNQ